MRAALDLATLADALAASWGADTAYERTFDSGNPARGQCYPTARVVQHFFPELEIARGWVDTGSARERHFWNMTDEYGWMRRIDLTWQQFPPASVRRGFETLDRFALGDSPPTVARCEVLLRRVVDCLGCG